MAAIALLASKKIDFDSHTLNLELFDLLFMTALDKISEDEVRLFLSITHDILTESYKLPGGVSPNTQKKETNEFHFILKRGPHEINFGEFNKVYSHEEISLVSSQLFKKNLFLPYGGTHVVTLNVQFDFTFGNLSKYIYDELVIAAKLIDDAIVTGR